MLILGGGWRVRRIRGCGVFFVLIRGGLGIWELEVRLFMSVYFSDRGRLVGVLVGFGVS